MSIAGKRFIGIALEESVYGTPIAAEEWIAAADESITEDHGFLYPETGIMGREESQGIPGPFKIAGPFSFPVNADNVTKLLRLLLGGYACMGDPPLETGGGDTTMDADAAKDATVIPVTATLNFAVDDFIAIGIGKKIEFRKVTVVNVDISLEVDKGVSWAHVSGEKVREVDVASQVAVEAAAGQKDIDVDTGDGALFGVGDFICVGQGWNAECCKIASIATDKLTVTDNLLYTHAVDDEVVKTYQRFVHIFKAASAIKSTTIEDCPGVGDKSRQMAGTIIKSIGFEAPARDFLSASVAAVIRKPKLIDSTTPTVSAVRTFVFYEDSITFEGSALAKVHSWSMTYENDIDEDNFVHGDRFLEGILLGGSKFEGEMELIFKDWEMHQYFWGSATATEPTAAEIPTRAIVFNFLGLGTGGTAGNGFDKYQLEVNVPNAQLTASEPNWAKRETIIQRVGVKALVIDQDYAVQFSVVNLKYRP